MTKQTWTDEDEIYLIKLGDGVLKSNHSNFKNNLKKLEDFLKKKQIILSDEYKKNKEEFAKLKNKFTLPAIDREEIERLNTIKRSDELIDKADKVLLGESIKLGF